MTSRRSPLATSQTMAVRSSEPEASSAPLDEKRIT